MKQRVIYYDLLNTLACLGVIFLHCNGCAHVFSDTLRWKQALMVEVGFYWAVPVFFMLSGATLMNYRESYDTKTFFRRRFLRTVVPFIFWSLLNLVIYSKEVFLSDPRVWIERIFFTQTENVYWFFIPLFSMYLSMPVLSLLKENRRILWYMVGSAFLLQSLLPSLFSLLGMSYNGGLNVSVMGGYLLFALLGYLLSTETLSRRQRIVIYILGIFGALLRYGFTWFSSVATGTLNRTMFNYFGFYSVFLAAAVFVFFRYNQLSASLERFPILIRILKELASCSFGIYLIHMILYLSSFSWIPKDSWPSRLILPFLIYIVGFFIVYLLKKIPILQRIVP